MIKNKLILGTVQFGLNYGINNTLGKPSTENIKNILDTAYSNGINILDTAEAYGNSQARIGQYHKNSNNKFEVITKFSSSIKNLSSNINIRVKKNIEILNVNSLYCYMFHSFNDFKTYYKSFEKNLVNLKEEGFVKKIGVSLYTNEEFETVLNYNTIDVVQLPFNLLDNISKRGRILAKAKAKGIEIHTRSAFLQGLFFKSPNTLNETLKPLSSSIKHLQNLCSSEYKINDLALNYAYHQKDIDHILIGVDSASQLEENLLSVNKFIDQEIIEKINNIDIIETELLNPSNWNR